MKKILLLSIALLSLTDHATAQLAAVVNGQVVRQVNIQDYVTKVKNLIRNFAANNNLKITQAASNFIDETQFINLIASNNKEMIIAAVANPVRSQLLAYTNIIQLQTSGAIPQNVLNDLHAQFINLQKSDKHIELHYRSGTPANGDLIALYRNPKAGVGNQLDIVQVRIVNK